MTDRNDQRELHDGSVDKPRSPDQHGQTGTGGARSADRGLPAEGGLAGGEAAPAVTTGMRSTSQPAFSDEVTMNRSGSGGSGGPAEADPGLEGSTGQSMSELLAGDEETQASDS